MGEFNRVREGFVTIECNDARGGSFRFHGLPVLGYRDGQAVNRILLNSRFAPSWFAPLCARHTGTSFELKVRVIRTSGGEVAFVTPVAGSEEEAMREWQSRVQSHGKKPLGNIEAVQETIRQAHEYKAKQESLQILEHFISDRVNYAIAKDADGITYKVSGGTLVGKLTDDIKQGKTTLEAAVNIFVRVRPHL